MKRLFYRNTQFWGQSLITHLGTIILSSEGVVDLEEELAEAILKDYPNDFFSHFPSPEKIDSIIIGGNDVEIPQEEPSRKEMLMSLSIEELKELAQQADMPIETINKLAKRKENLVNYILTQEK